MPKLVNVRLDLKVPGIGGVAGTWEPDESEVSAAWELYVEMVTRTPLGGFSSQEGSLREALNSIYSLFDTTRGILRRYGPAVARPKGGRELSFGYLAVSMLNLVLRPLLTEWHPDAPSITYFCLGLVQAPAAGIEAYSFRIDPTETPKSGGARTGLAAAPTVWRGCVQIRASASARFHRSSCHTSLESASPRARSERSDHEPR